MWWLILLISILLAFLSCPFFPTLAFILFRRRDEKDNQTKLIDSIDILIPCHNEKNRLRQTLQSLENAEFEAQKLFPQLRLNILVGLDACTDGTETDAFGFKVSTHKFNHRSKWRVLNDLVNRSQSDWVALIDAGTLWDKRIIRNVIPYLSLSNLSCFAPGYRIAKAGHASKAFWFVEALLKTLENKSGGPVSVHGATVFYRREQLSTVLKTLAGRVWINDDVVLPLTLKALFPEHHIHYGANAAGGFLVTDSSPRQNVSENNGRTRIAFGNLQWIRHLLPIARALHPRVFVVALRRVFRLIWALPATFFLCSFILWAIEYALTKEKPTVPIILFFASLIALFALIRTPAFRASIKALVGLCCRADSEEDNLKWS